jgi:glucose-6-phosphate dehydrogenase assembly protein OpcA
LRSVLLPLTVPDLPLIVWCRSARLPQVREFWQIAAMAQKLVLDTSASPDPPGSLLRAAAIAESGILLGDLSWTLLTRWREMLAQVFENHENAAQLPKISAIDLEWGGSRQVPALYLGAWIRDSLVHAGVNPALHFARMGDGDLLRVRLTGEGFAAAMTRQDDRMVVTLNGASQCTNLPHPTDYMLMREELGIVRHDAVFEATLASAARLLEPSGEGEK